MTSKPSILGVTQTPVSFAVPKGACDCHVHIFGPDDKFPFSPDRAYTPPNALIADLDVLHSALHIDRVVVVHPSPYGADNACTVDAVRRMGARARGVAVINDKTSDAELDAMHEAGIRGVRVNLESAGEQDPAKAGQQLQTASARVARLGWHVQTYTNLRVLQPLTGAILKMPTPLVVDHFGLAQAADGTGQPGFSELLSLLRGGKIYVKISAAYRISTVPGHADVAPIARAIIDANPDNVVWGTDWPHPGGSRRDPMAIEPYRPIDNGAAINRLASWTKSDTELRKILVDNPARLYQF
ncbi:MAG TPA: amidohydrolase family protein [Pseudolabrys sp.]